MYPHPVLPGQTIGLCSPSSYVDVAQIEAGKAALEHLGYRVHVHPQAMGRLGHTQIAGTVAERVHALHDLTQNPNVDGILFAGGGNRALELLPHLDLAAIAAARKPIMGFSDATAILNAITAHTKLVTYHGPVAKWLPHLTHTQDRASFEAALAGRAQAFTWDTKAITQGKATGPLFGGNLSVFSALLLAPDMHIPPGALIFLEDNSEEINRIDRAFLALRPYIKAHRIGGLILGDFSAPKDTGRPFGFTLPEIAHNALGDLGIPVAYGAPFGHGDRLVSLPIGGVANLDVAHTSTELSYAAMGQTA